MAKLRKATWTGSSRTGWNPTRFSRVNVKCAVANYWLCTQASVHNTYHTVHPEKYALKWHHNGRDGVSNHQPHDCLLNRLCRRRSKKTSKLRFTRLCAGEFNRWPVNSPHKWPATGKMFPFDDVTMLTAIVLLYIAVFYHHFLLPIYFIALAKRNITVIQL